MRQRVLTARLNFIGTKFSGRLTINRLRSPTMTSRLRLTMNPRQRKKRLKLPCLSVDERMDLDEHDGFDLVFESDLVLDSLEAMIQKEQGNIYTCQDYLSMSTWQTKTFLLAPRDSPNHMPPSNSSIDEYCREQIAEWSFRVVDYFRIDREVVAMSMSFLDRFLATCRCDRTSFKLAATTTLHLAVKLLYPCKLADLGILSDLSRGEFDMKDVCQMESHILLTLSWHMHPPTAMSFAALFLDHFFSSRSVNIPSGDIDDIYDVAAFFTELAVLDYFFVPMKDSSIALASMLNALEGMYGPDNLLANDIVLSARSMNLGSLSDLSAARNRLWELYERSEECALHGDKPSDEDHVWHSNIFAKKISTQLSPVSVNKEPSRMEDPNETYSYPHDASW